MRAGLPVITVVCLLILAAGPSIAQLGGGPSWSGSLTWSADSTQGLNALGDWAAPGTTLSWTVSQLDDYMWRYSYDLTVTKKDISHLILQTSLNVTDADIYNVTGTFANDGSGWSVGLWDTEGNSNPQMPDSIYGVKFDLGGDYTTLKFSFDCPRDPVWGDFYAKDGKSKLPGQTEVVAQVWNAGFSYPDWDPSDHAGPGSVAGHVLTPDTTWSVPPPPNETPEPATWVLLGATAIVGVIRKRRNSSV